MNNKTSNYHELLRAVARGLLMGSLLSAALFGGYFLRVLTEPPPPPLHCQEYTILSEAESQLRRYYYRSLPEERALEYAAIRGLIQALDDPYTRFVEPQAHTIQSQALEGEYGGVGVEVERDELGRFLLYPAADSPAAAAGILAGDVLLAVNGAPIAAAASLDEVTLLLRGPEGETVELLVLHQEEESEQTIAVTFATIEVPSVTWRLIADAPQIGYLHLVHFTARTPDELQGALAELDRQGAEALILDLRDNPGGFLQEAVEVASEFLDGEVVAYETRRGAEDEVFRAGRGGRATVQPLAVLINGGSASASELVAGAIQTQGRGVLIGQQSYGKGSVQFIIELSDHSSLHITSALWLRPDHTPIDGQGLTPDLLVAPQDTQSDEDAALAEAIRYLSEQLAAGRP